MENSDSQVLQIDSREGGLIRGLYLVSHVLWPSPSLRNGHSWGGSPGQVELHCLGE